MHIRPAGTDDIPAVMEIERCQFPLPWTAEHLQAVLSQRLCFFFVAEDDGSLLVGFMVGWLLEGEMELHQIAVRPDRQNQGIGGRLLDFLVAEARHRRADRIRLEVRPSNAAAIRLYEKQGYRRRGIRRDYYPFPAEDAWVYELELSSKINPHRP